jgi:hypothetical protein
MGSAPAIAKVELQECCKKSIRDINQILTAGKWLQRLILPLGALNCFVSPSKGAALTTINSVRATDWELLAKATMAIPEITKNRVRQIAGMEAIKHIGKLSEFWKATYDAFQ